MRSLLHQALVENAPLKLAAFALSLVLFVVVRGDREAVTSVHAKVVYLYPAERVLMSDPVTEVRITVRGPSNQLSRLDERYLDAVRVDLRQAEPGELRFGEEMVRLPPGLRLESISPSGMQLRFERRLRREVPVQPVLAGDPAPGYRVARSSAEPRTAVVSGAASVVEQITRAPTRPLLVADARQSVRGEVELAPPPTHADWQLDGPVTVAVEVVAALGESALHAVPVRVTGAQRVEAWVDPAAVEVLLRGPLEALPTGGPRGLALLVDAQAEDAHPPGAVVRKRIAVVGLPPGVAAEVRPETVTLFTRRRRD
jgi:hypothetical protein